jgi:hypothetical protein
MCFRKGFCSKIQYEFFVSVVWAKYQAQHKYFDTIRKDLQVRNISLRYIICAMPIINDGGAGIATGCGLDDRGVGV